MVAGIDRVGLLTAVKSAIAIGNGYGFEPHLDVMRALSLHTLLLAQTYFCTVSGTRGSVFVNSTARAIESKYGESAGVK